MSQRVDFLLVTEVTRVKFQYYMYARARIPVQHGLHMAFRPHEDLFSFTFTLPIFILTKKCIQPFLIHIVFLEATVRLVRDGHLKDTSD